MRRTFVGISRPTLDPGRDLARQIASPQIRRFRVAQARPELQPLVEKKTVGEHAQHQMLGRLRRVARGDGAALPVDAAVDVREAQTKLIARRRQAMAQHSSPMRASSGPGWTGFFAPPPPRLPSHRVPIGVAIS